MVERQTIFPNTSHGFSRSASDMPVLLNGMRVLFDEKVALYPVEVEPDHPDNRPRVKQGNGRDDGQYANA